MAEDNHYEVLGIRPSASLLEIELAYKGRRSQYHPDRYAEVDEASVAWATAKMQEVNKAYTVLKDPRERERFDRTRPTRQSRSEPEPEVKRPKPEPSPQRSLRQALEGLEFSNEPFERVFVAPYIPRKKLWGALDSYGEGVRAQDVVVLIDDTVFGGAREGIWITETQIRSKAKFEDEDVRLLGLLSDITVRGAHIRIHGEPYATLSMPNFDDLQLLFGAINAYLKEAH